MFLTVRKKEENYDAQRKTNLSDKIAPCRGAEVQEYRNTV
jgi:hypothetical protein